MTRMIVYSHPAVLGVNRGVYRQLARIADAELVVVAPDRWKADMIVDLTCTFEPEDAPLTLKPTPVLGRRLPRNNSLFIFRSRIEKSLNGWRPDIVLVEEEPWSLAALQVLSSFPSARRAFYTDQNLYKRYPLPFRQIEQRVLRMTDIALIRSDSCGDVLRKKGYAGKLHLSPHSYDPALFQPIDDRSRADMRSRLGIPADTQLVGFAGRLTEGKGVQDLLDAWSILRHRASTAAHLLFIGNGPLREVASRAAVLDTSIHLLPAFPHDQVGQAIASLDLLVLPSRTTPAWKEQWGRVIVEAAACGVAVIGSNSGEIPHLIARLASGESVPERNPQALADGIERLLESRELRSQYSSSGFERSRALYSHKTVARELALALDLKMRPAASELHLFDKMSFDASSEEAR